MEDLELSFFLLLTICFLKYFLTWKVSVKIRTPAYQPIALQQE